MQAGIEARIQDADLQQTCLGGSPGPGKGKGTAVPARGDRGAVVVAGGGAVGVEGAPVGVPLGTDGSATVAVGGAVVGE